MAPSYEMGESLADVAILEFFFAAEEIMVIEEEDMRCVFQSFGNIMGNHDDGDAFLLQFLDVAIHLFRSSGIKSRDWFVEKNHFSCSA